MSITFEQSQQKRRPLQRICSLPVLIFEFSWPTGYIRVKHLFLMSSRVQHFSYASSVDGFRRVPGWFSWLSWYKPCTELSCAIVFAMTWHRTLFRSAGSHVFSPNLTFKSYLPCKEEQANDRKEYTPENKQIEPPNSWWMIQFWRVYFLKKWVETTSWTSGLSIQLI